MSKPPPRLSILGHLADMRKHLLRSVIAVGITTALAFVFYDRIFSILLYPAGEMSLIFTEVTEMISTIVLVSLVSGIMLGHPLSDLRVHDVRLPCSDSEGEEVLLPHPALDGYHVCGGSCL